MCQRIRNLFPGEMEEFSGNENTYGLCAPNENLLDWVGFRLWAAMLVVAAAA